MGAKALAAAVFGAAALIGAALLGDKWLFLSALVIASVILEEAMRGGQEGGGER